MQFNNVIGQTELKKKLIGSVRNNTVSHAQLFLGPLGYGGLPLALAFSQYLQCENQQEGDSCGKCPSCVKAQKLIHPDIHFSFPFPKIEKKELCDEFFSDWREALIENPYLDLLSWMTRFDAENKQPHIPIKECHNIIHKLSLKAYESPWKVMILWLPEYLGNNGNTLLKIVEEPPERTVFILVAENRDSVLNTILSRTQITRIPHIEHTHLTEALLQKFDLSNEDAFRLANISNGDYIEASRQLQNAFGQLAELFREWMELCLPGNHPPTRILSLYGWIEKFAAIGRENQKSFFKNALHFLRETLYFQITGKPTPLLAHAEVELSTRLMQYADPDTLPNLSKLFNDSHFHTERNAHPKMLMMHLSLKVMGALKMSKATV